MTLTSNIVKFLTKIRDQREQAISTERQLVLVGGPAAPTTTNRPLRLPSEPCIFIERAADNESPDLQGYGLNRVSIQNANTNEWDHDAKLPFEPPRLRYPVQSHPFDSPAADWPTYRADAARTGHSADSLPDSLEVCWTHQMQVPRPAWPTSARISYDFAHQPIIVGSTIVIGSTVDDSVGTGGAWKAGAYDWGPRWSSDIFVSLKRSGHGRLLLLRKMIEEKGMNNWQYAVGVVSKMKGLLIHLVPAAILVTSARAEVPYCIEAEDVVANRDAWVADVSAPDKWNLWSTDRDADKKWSGGVVLRSPLVMKDRQNSAEGAPPLHIRIEGLSPEQEYCISLKSGRVLAISLDGKGNWQRYTSGLIPGARAAKGVIEFFVDDRYAVESTEGRGSSYLDCIYLAPSTPLDQGIPDGGFEKTQNEKMPAGWEWKSREGKGTAAVTESDHRTGRNALNVTSPEDERWSLTHRSRIRVEPDTELELSGWAKAAIGRVSAEIIGVGKKTRRIGAAQVSDAVGWREMVAFALVPEDVSHVYVQLTGAGETDVLVDDIVLRKTKADRPLGKKVDGWAKKRIEEKMDRGVSALQTDDGVFVSWRLLRDDPDGIAFDLYRKTGDSSPEKINPEPIRNTTCLLDESPTEGNVVYEVRPAGSENALKGSTPVSSSRSEQCSYLRVPLKVKDTTVQKIGLADLNGDGRYDFVIKQPNQNIDPASTYWKPSPETYKIEAYLHDGTFLWRNDLGWAIERGIWYSPWIAFDLTGDGKTEVAAKIGEGDPRDEDGRVRTGREWMVVWDGMTGQEIARTSWPAREHFSRYNLESRNQIAVAYLDGKTPCLLALRGTYSRMLVDAYQLKGGTLDLLWQYDNRNYGKRYWGQGAHFTLAADVDSDGRDEVILGSAVIDDDGTPLWSTGKGHPDAAYLSDVDPAQPGWEIGYVMETRQLEGGGLCLARAADGEILWMLDQPTGHVHSKGMCADVDPTIPGMEIYGADSTRHKPTGDKWLFAADGELLLSGEQLPYGFAIPTVYWDADLQKELLRGKIRDYQGSEFPGRIEGSVRLVADVIGDWREEIITSMPGELRIYSTTIPATDRRVCLLQDPVYRLSTAMNSMGYTQDPTLSTCLEAVSPGMNLTLREGKDDVETILQVVVSAPLDKQVKGRVQLAACDGIAFDPAEFSVAVASGERDIRQVRLSMTRNATYQGSIKAVLEGKDCSLKAECPAFLRKKKSN